MTRLGRAERGLIPFRLHIGVTGHRYLNDAGRVADAAVTAVNEVIAAVRSASPLRVSVLSSLADGADRVVVDRLMKVAHADLEVVLPMAREEYGRDFSTQSKNEFDRLVAGALLIEVVPEQMTREGMYAAAGRLVVDRCDVLVAVWDGETSRGTGGTGDVVSYARAEEVPVVVINPFGDVLAPLAGERLVELADQARQIHRYNAWLARISRASVRREWHRQPLSGVEVAPDGMDLLAEWRTVFFERTDLFASRMRRWYEHLSDALMLMSAASVGVLAAQATLAPSRPGFALIEGGLLLVGLVIVVTGRRRRLHDRWISFRFLAERARSAPFLAIAGVGMSETGWERLGNRRGRRHHWLRRASE